MVLYVGLVAPHFACLPEALLRPCDGMDLPAPKLHPDTGYQRHPWVEKQNAMMDTETRFVDEEERRRAFVAYYGLVSWMDHNVGQIITALEEAGLSDDTTAIYSSDHGDNVGRAGCGENPTCMRSQWRCRCWRRIRHCHPGVCGTPVSLLDLAAGIPAHFGLTPDPEMAACRWRKLLPARRPPIGWCSVNTMRLAR